MVDSRKALKIVYGQIGFVGLFGCSLVLIAIFRPSFFEAAPWAPGGCIVLLAINVYAYLRRYEKASRKDHQVEAQRTNGSS